ncbi:unnamed protein product [Nesidiocoris tenuis]|uniref:Uncharacterized protein n=1 Tax=Nesidiocoris tenuis TaxID=355587 RepID=A0A6H5HPA1_9HEMI|nr:unnamed protein product [Nesidiocoris tenuis]CAB0020270.1 unnamed protein product [Nesidiocoris tenuis]
MNNVPQDVCLIWNAPGVCLRMSRNLASNYPTDIETNNRDDFNRRVQNVDFYFVPTQLLQIKAGDRRDSELTGRLIVSENYIMTEKNRHSIEEFYREFNFTLRPHYGLKRAAKRRNTIRCASKSPDRLAQPQGTRERRRARVSE